MTLKNKNILACLIAGTAMAGTTQAADQIWGGTNSTTTTSAWTLATNWGGAPAAVPTVGALATFGGLGSASVTLSVSTNAKLLFTGSQAYTISGSELTVGGGSAIVALDAANAANQTVNSNVFIGAAAGSIVLLNNASTSNSLVIGGNIGGSAVSNTGIANALQITNKSKITLSGSISDILSGKVNAGPFNIQKIGGGVNGVGNLELNGNSSFTGGTDYFAGSGSFTLGHKNALGTGPLRLNGGGVDISSNTPLAGANAVANTIRLNGALSTVAGTTDVTAITLGSPTATVSSATNLAVGQTLNYESVMRNFPIGTYIASISGTSITFSQNALTTAAINSGTGRFRSFGSASGTHTFSGSNDLEFSGTVYLGSGFADAGTASQTFNVTNTGVTTFSGTLTEEASIEGTGLVQGALIKTGLGKLVLSGANTYTGNTQVNAGSLFINNASGSATGTGAVTVNAGTLGGNGFVTGAVTVGNSGTDVPFDAILAPGNSIESIDTGNLLFRGDAKFAVEINGTLATNDVVNVTGTVGLSAGIADLDVALTGLLATSQKYWVITNDLSDAVTGTFAGLAQDATILTNNGYNLKISYVGDFAGAGQPLTAGNDVVLYTVAVPEPTSLAVIAGLAVLGLKRRRA